MRRPLLSRALLYPSLLTGALALACGHALAATAWVSNEKDNSLSLIDLQTLEVTETLAVGQRPGGCCCRMTTSCCTSAPAIPTGYR